MVILSGDVCRPGVTGVNQDAVTKLQHLVFLNRVTAVEIRVGVRRCAVKCDRPNGLAVIRP